MPDRIPIGTLPGLTSQLDGVDILVATLGVGATVTRCLLRHTEYAASGATDTSVTGAIRNATGGGGSGISFTIPDQTQSVVVTGSLSVGSSASIYLRVTAGSDSMNLTGWVEVAGAAAPATTALTTLARVKEYLGITASTWDDQFNNHIAEVSAEIQSWLGRKIVETTSTGEKFDSSGRNDALIVTGFPVISVASLTEDGTALVEDTGFELTEQDRSAGRITRIDSSGNALAWARGARNITVTYTHGFSSVPEGVTAAATRLVAADFRESQPGGGRFGLDGKALDTGGAAGYRSRADIWESLSPALAPYRRVI